MPIEGISHITLVVQDSARSAELLKAVLDAREVYASERESFSIAPERFLLVGGVWLALMEGPVSGGRDYRHVAFKIPDGELEAYRDRLEAVGVEFGEGRPRRPGEGRSLYFFDYDDHMFELHSGTLEGRLRAYADASGAGRHHET